jgi:hypothetical protein
MRYIVKRHKDMVSLTREEDGARRSVGIERSLKVWSHSPTGFETGYGGSGPAQLALAILLDFGLSDEEAVRHHQHLKNDVIQRNAIQLGEQYILTATALTAWLERRRAVEALP